jgi:pimeloyl-ACP methyl ester carboxylesterase
VFGEHRFFGKSMPFGNKTFVNINLKYLTVEQAMMDYVKLIQHVKGLYAAENSPVITFGGSYGGMLAVWLRMKYPHIFQGALASSAPILFFQGATSPYAYNQVATKAFANGNPGCPDLIRNGFYALNATKGNTAAYTQV